MLWDYGTWQPEVDDPDAALRKGDLKFTLDGYKLKGSWVLVRTRDRSDVSPGQRGRSWLLIKHRDHWSGAIDITTFAPRSVKSDGEFEDILAADMPEIWGLEPSCAERRHRRAADPAHRAGHGKDARTDTGRARTASGVSGVGRKQRPGTPVRGRPCQRSRVRPPRSAGRRQSTQRAGSRSERGDPGRRDEKVPTRPT